MSQPITQNVRCPKCGTDVPFTMWASLNVSLNPAEKQALLSGDLFRVTCPACNTVTPLVYPMLYHDMERRRMIWMLPRDATGELIGPGTASAEAAQKMPGYTFRTVHALNELLEKILIFDADLDDLAIEMIKVIIATQLEAGGQPKDAKIHFAQIDRDAAGQEQLVFAVVTPTGTRGATLPREPVYTNMCKAANELLNRRPPPPPGEWPRVDNAYLMRLMNAGISP
jgi:hypothetical protein